VAARREDAAQPRPEGIPSISWHDRFHVRAQLCTHSRRTAADRAVTSSKAGNGAIRSSTPGSQRQQFCQCCRSSIYLAMPAHRSRTSHPSTAAADGCYLLRRMSTADPLQSSGPLQSGCSCAETRGSPPISDLPDSVTGGCEPLNDLAFPDHRINRATASIRTAN
jgi:hypothetical protein